MQLEERKVENQSLKPHKMINKVKEDKHAGIVQPKGRGCDEWSALFTHSWDSHYYHASYPLPYIGANSPTFHTASQTHITLLQDDTGTTGAQIWELHSQITRLESTASTLACPNCKLSWAPQIMLLNTYRTIKFSYKVSSFYFYSSTVTFNNSKLFLIHYNDFWIPLEMKRPYILWNLCYTEDFTILVGNQFIFRFC